MRGRKRESFLSVLHRWETVKTILESCYNEIQDSDAGIIFSHDKHKLSKCH